MNEIETKIIAGIKSWSFTYDDKKKAEFVMEIDKLLNQFFVMPLESMTPEFINSEFTHYSNLAMFLSLTRKQSQQLRVDIVKYLFSKDSADTKEKMFLELQQKLEEDLKTEPGLSPILWLDEIIMRIVYLSKDDKLIALFIKKLPIPSLEFFSGQEIPSLLAKHWQEKIEKLSNFLKKNKDNPLKVDRTILRLQRNFRRRLRNKEEQKRIQDRYKYYTTKIPKEWRVPYAELAAINRGPYIPQCEEKLRNRILKVSESKELEFIESIHHLTSASALESIFNDGLFGRQTLLKFNMPFKPSVLDFSDILNGDANVICFGPFKIDPKAKRSDTIRITLDFKTVPKDNPCIFFKEKDLGYTEYADLKDPDYSNPIKKVSIGDSGPFYFSHTYLPPSIHLVGGFTYFQLYKHDDPSRMDEYHAYSGIPNVLLIAYDASKIHQILALNFFRFVDKLIKPTGEKDEASIRNIYARIAQLDDKQLIQFLKDIGTQMSQTAEFNYFGAYKFDFSSILTIKKEAASAPGTVFAPEPFTLHLPHFIADLEAGKPNILAEAVKNIPNIFKSYRFLDFLLSKISNQENRKALQTLRDACTVPAWIKMPSEKAAESILAEKKKLV